LQKNNLFSNNYEAFVNRAPIGIFKTNSKGEIIGMNPEMANIMGGNSLANVKAKYNRLQEDFYYRPERRKEFIAELKKKKEVKNFVIEAIREDGIHIWLRLDARICNYNADDSFEIDGFAVDITELKEKEFKINKLNRLYKILSNINQAIVHLKETDLLLDRACQIIVKDGGFNLAWIGKLVNQGEVVNKVAGAARNSDHLSELKERIAENEHSAGPVWQAINSGSYVIDKKTPNSSNTVASFPIYFYGQIWGVINIYADTPDSFIDEVVDLFAELALDISFALETIKNEKMRKEVQLKLRMNERKYRSFFDNYHSIMLVINIKDGKIVDANPAAVKYYGWSHAELTNMKIADINTLSENEISIEMHKAQTEERDHFFFRHRLADGEIRDVEVHSGPVLIDDKDYLLSIIHDVTERKIAEEKIKYISFHDELTGLYNRAYLEAEVDRLDSKRQLPLGIIMGDANGLKLVNDTYGHQQGDKLLIKTAEILKKYCRSEDIIARVGGDEFVIVLPKTSFSETEMIISRIKRACHNSSGNPIPVSIALGAAVKQDLDQDIWEVLKSAEERMYKNKLTESRSAKSNVLTALLNTLNEKSNETEAHAWRLQKLGIELGTEVELSGHELDRLSLMATLHDIGKVTVPANILGKKGRLTAEEYEIVKKHAETGYRITSSIDTFAHIAEGILYHHEWWDGSGYPEGLKEEEIPLLARIISIVDAFDVMTHDRPYRRAMSKEAALVEINAGAGSQFDPELVKLFNNISK